MTRLWFFALAVIVLAASGYAQTGNAPPVPTPRPKAVTAGTGAYTEDPRKVMAAARNAIKLVERLSYDATYESTGAMSTRSSSSSGKVSLSKLDADNPFKARMASSGTFISSGTDEKVDFAAAFDGEKIEKLLTKSRSVGFKTLSADNPRERTLGAVTGYFGGGPYQLLLLDFLTEEPLRREMEATVADYEGRAAISGTLCHVVYIEYTDPASGKVRRERLFIGVKDNLPRRIETIAADNDGRYGAYVLTLSNLRINPVFTTKTFSVAAPKGFVEKPFPEQPAPILLKAGDAAPNWKLADDRGVEKQLVDYKGKIVVLDFWATWCGPCIQAMPGLQKLHEKYKDRDVVVIGVNSWEESNAAEYMRRGGFNYGLLLKGERIAEDYHVPSLPTLYIIDRNGKVAHAVKGLDDNLAPLIEKLLSETAN